MSVLSRFIYIYINEYLHYTRVLIGGEQTPAGLKAIDTLVGSEYIYIYVLYIYLY